jgi:ATP-dependent RNA helicase DeaD
VQLWVGAGLEARVRPADLVGAIANEAEVPGKEIGPIVIYDDYSVVGVPARYLNQILQSMAGASIRGREAALRLATARDTAPHPPRRAAHSESPRSSRRKPARLTRKEFSKPARRDTKGKKKKRK